MTADSDYETFVAPLEDRLIRSVWRIVGDPHDADDALQDALAAIWRRIEDVRRHPNPRALVLRITVNAAYDVLRRRRRRPTVELPPADPEAPSSEGAEEQAMRRERRDAVREALGSLSRKQALAVLMRDAEGESYEDVAQALGCRQATARKHVARARARLRGLLPDVLTGNLRGVEGR